MTQSSLLQRVLEADAAEDAFDDDDYEVDTPKRRHRGKGRVSGNYVTIRLSRATVEVSGVVREVTDAHVSGDSHSVWFFSLRVEVRAAGGQTQMTTSHISVTVSRDGSRRYSLLLLIPFLFLIRSRLCVPGMWLLKLAAICERRNS